MDADSLSWFVAGILVGAAIAGMVLEHWALSSVRRPTQKLREAGAYYREANAWSPLTIAGILFRLRAEAARKVEADEDGEAIG